MIKKHLNSLQKTVCQLDRDYIFKNGFWLSFSQVLSMAAILFTSYIFANYVSRDDYGIYKYIISLGIILSAFSLSGMPQAMLQAASKKDFSFFYTGYKKAIQYGSIVTIISLSVALYYFLNDNTTIAIGCILIAIFQPIINANQIGTSFLHGSHKFNVASGLQILKILISSLSIIGVIFLSENVLYIVLAFYISNILVTLGQNWFISKKLKENSSILTSEASTKYISYAKHTSLRNIITGITGELDKIIVFQTLGATELAIYAFAIAIPEQIKGGFKNLAVLILVKFAKYDMQNIKRNLHKKTFLLAIILFVLTVLYILSTPFIYRTLFPEYQESILLSQIFALSFLSMIVIMPISALQSQMKERELYFINISTSILQIFTMYFSTIYFGLIGLVLGRIAIRYLYCLISFFFFLKNND